MISKKNKNNHQFSGFAKIFSDIMGSALTFIIALIIIVCWVISGPFFKFSNTWQLIVNTGTSIITFLMVFLIQNTQNRDTKILNLKIDELIKSQQKADNFFIDLKNLSDDDLKYLEKEYQKLCEKGGKE